MRKTVKRNNKNSTKTKKSRKKTLEPRNLTNIKGKIGNFKQSNLEDQHNDEYHR